MAIAAPKRRRRPSDQRPVAGVGREFQRGLYGACPTTTCLGGSVGASTKCRAWPGCSHQPLCWCGACLLLVVVGGQLGTNADSPPSWSRGLHVVSCRFRDAIGEARGVVFTMSDGRCAREEASPSRASSSALLRLLQVPEPAYPAVVASALDKPPACAWSRGAERRRRPILDGRRVARFRFQQCPPRPPETSLCSSRKRSAGDGVRQWPRSFNPLWARLFSSPAGARPFLFASRRRL